jgi:quaternary ammonium compound-resistance protein SugE
MAWTLLIVSGFLEAVWATALGASDGFRKKKATVLFVVALAASMVGLAFAMTALPTGTAYAVWVGIGTVLTVVIAAGRRKERLTWARIALLVLLIACVVGLKAVS